MNKLFNLLMNMDFSKFGSISFPEENDSQFDKLVENKSTPTHNIKIEKWTSRDGTQSFERIVSTSKIENKSKSIDQLRSDLSMCIEKEDFENACKIRDEIRKIESKSK